ncbi:hypothetical protein EKE94_11250 [Mesobaculum littorinae]|uniref:Hpt domain-containing protein n=1 Tax=Mesobaculum littorinae TaxID=2486419 RepID=A0A438AH39_9RHOB|nr:Hpt domain-containing protein [Mesobaculum littorinae]RVV98033.1 hypothetical protein EKE94_11250 [Mesobaculum littorinae]
MEICWQRLNEVRDDIGVEDFADIVHLFLEETEEGLTSLDWAGPVQDRADRLHFVKGAALNLGLSGLAEGCSAAGRHALEDPEQAQADLLTCFDRTRAVLTEELGPPPDHGGA